MFALPTTAPPSCVPAPSPRAPPCQECSAVWAPPPWRPRESARPAPTATAPRRGQVTAAAVRWVCRASSVRDRGEWTRFLEWTDSDGSGGGGEGASRAGVECLLLDDGAAAEVTVSAPDRPGLLSDISRAIAATGFNIEKARVTTPSSVARNTFRVTRAGGEALSESALIELRKAVVTCASKSYATRKAAAAGADKMSDVSVDIMSFEPASVVASRPQWVIRVEAADAPGVLSNIVASLFTLGLDVVSAEVKTSLDGRVNNQFQVIRPDHLDATTATEQLRACLTEGPPRH